MAKKLKTLRDLFEDTLKDVYYAENKILKTLPKMAKASQSRDLKAAFTKHERETRGQVARLEKVFKIIGKPPRGKVCDAINGITDEGAEIMKEFKGAPALDGVYWHLPRRSSTTRSLATARSGHGPKSSVSTTPRSCSKRRSPRRKQRIKISPPSPSRSSISKQKLKNRTAEPHLNPDLSSPARRRAALAQSVGEKTGAISTFGISPTSADFLKEVAINAGFHQGLDARRSFWCGPLGFIVQVAALRAELIRLQL